MNTVERDCGDYIEVIPQGLFLNSDKIVIMAGAELPQQPNRTVFTVPPIVFKYPKELPENMTLETLAEQICQEARDKFMESFKEGFEKAKAARNQTAHIVTNEAHSMDQEAGADILAMKELNSALDNCAKGHCAACKL